jgi:hypothetical protein
VRHAGWHEVDFSIPPSQVAQSNHHPSLIGPSFENRLGLSARSRAPAQLLSHSVHFYFTAFSFLKYWDLMNINYMCEFRLWHCILCFSSRIPRGDAPAGRSVRGHGIAASEKGSGRATPPRPGKVQSRSWMLEDVRRHQDMFNVCQNMSRECAHLRLRKIDK